MKKIAILIHKHDKFINSAYLLAQVTKIWESQGFEISVLHGPAKNVEADIVISHVDLTITPPEYRNFLDQFPLVLNGQVNDISKNLISSNLVQHFDDYQGPVIIKSNLNYWGINEGTLFYRKFFLLKAFLPIVRLFQKLRPWNKRAWFPEEKYLIFQSSSEVFDGIWTNPELIVEKFIPERYDNFYCLRVWIFFGDCETNTINYSNNPVVKGENVVRTIPVPVEEIPENLRELRRKFDFDYGKFDYVIDADGQAILFDANRTPHLGSIDLAIQARLAQKMAEGIKSFM